MVEEEFAYRGAYYPGFLHIDLSTSEDVSDPLRLLADPTKNRLFSTFLHEYVHFLQDISTTFGMTYAGNYTDWIRDVAITVKSAGKTLFDVPVKLNNDFNALTNRRLMDIYKGDIWKAERYILYQFYVEEIEIVEDRSGNAMNVPKYKVYYNDSVYRSKSFYISPLCLKEYMAFQIQKMFYPGIDPMDDIPYNIIELIVQKEYPAFGSDTHHLIALCDVCLMAFHPMQVFFGLLSEMKKENFIPETIEDVYSFADKISFNGEIGSGGVLEIFQMSVDHVLQQLGGILNSTVMRSNYPWLRFVFEFGKNIRSSKLGFFSRLVDTPGVMSKEFLDLMEMLGTPFYTSNQASGYFIPPYRFRSVSIDAYQLSIFKEVISVLRGEKRGCGMKQFCDNSRVGDKPDDNCRNSPWERARLRTCPFADVWRAWGLIDFKPVFK